MKQSINTDKQCITKILKYTTDMQQILTNDNITSFQDLKKSLSTKYAATQLITNIYELSKKLQPDTLNSLKQFSNIEIRVARQIASHDYAKIDFKYIYDTCLKLTNRIVYNELNGFLKGDKNEKESN